MDQLGISGENLLVQLIAFLLFLAVFWRFALGPITRRSTSDRNGSARDWRRPSG